MKKLAGITDRRAQFKTIISLLINNQEYQFEGICKGTITETETGTNGFGYDAIFIPDGSSKTFAEMTIEEKNGFSHRANAVRKFAEWYRKK